MTPAVLRALVPLVAAACGSLLTSCSEDRAVPSATPTFEQNVASIFDAHCVSCHGDAAPAAGWRATSFLGAIACVAPGGAPASLPPTSRAPIVSALATAPHVGILGASDTATLQAWVAAGAPIFAGTVHPPGIIDPRSDAFHGTFLRRQRWSPMLDPNDANACGRCHDGTASRPAGVTFPAPGAPSCTTCHAEPEGVLACDTCHGNAGKTYPPRDLCFFPGDAAKAGAHATHVESSATKPMGLACSTCHPTPPAGVIGGLHGNGAVEVTFDPKVVGPEASFDPKTGACAVSCHDSGGAQSRPSWSSTTPMGCNGCHGSPPANHWPGPCTNCHAEANATGTALNGGPLHLNGRVDLGNGSGLCGACHGTGDSPWPATAAHAAHQNAALSAPVACGSCHVVPTSILDPTHLDGVVHVSFSGLAVARNAAPSWNGATCSNVACHGANLVEPPAVVPAWSDTSHAASACGACHGVPPSRQHTASASCGASNCHGAEITYAGSGAPLITPSGRSLHIDGLIESAQ